MDAHFPESLDADNKGKKNSPSFWMNTKTWSMQPCVRKMVQIKSAFYPLIQQARLHSGESFQVHLFVCLLLGFQQGMEAMQKE